MVLVIVDFGHILLILAFLALAGFILYDTSSFPHFITGGLGRAPGPDLFPRVLAISLIVCSLILLYLELRRVFERRRAALRSTEDPLKESTSRKSLWIKTIKSRSFMNFVIFTILSIMYIQTLGILGFVFATVPFLLLITMLLGVRLLQGGAFALVFTLAVFFFFTKILKVMLPLGFQVWIPFLR